MKKVLFILSSALLFAGTLSAQITIGTNNALPNSGTVYGTDITRTINFATFGNVILDQHFDSSTHNFVSDSFDGQMGSFVWYPSDTILTNQFFQTSDTSGFVMMNSEAYNDDTTYTQRVTLTSPAFSTMGVDVMRIALNHHYKNSVNDSAVLLMASTNGTNWIVLKDFTADSSDIGTPIDFATDTFTILNQQILNKPSVQLRLLYATDSGYHWAINRITVLSTDYTYGYDFFKPATNHSWDLSNITYANESKMYVRKVAPMPYSYIDSMYNDELLGLKHTTYGLTYYTLDGILEDAQLVYSQTILLDTFTNADDTLFLKVQPEIEYSGFNRILPFPATYNSRWASDYWYIEDLGAKGPTFGSIGASDTVFFRRYVTVSKRDTIKGWGRLRVKDEAGITQPYVNVLQLKTVVSQRDSFYLVGNDNTPAKRSALIAYLQSTGLDSVTQRNYTTMKFLREHDIIPFVTVWMNDTFVNRIEVHTNHPWPAAVGNVELADNNMTVYPNPVSGGMLNIEMSDATDGKWNAELVNNMGQVITSQPLQLGKLNSRAQVSVPSVIVPGIYYLRVSKDGQPVAIKPVSVMN